MQFSHTPTNAGGKGVIPYLGSNPLSEKIPQASEQPSQWVTTAESALPSQEAATTQHACAT